MEAAERRGMEEKICAICGRKYLAHRKWQKYCSPGCKEERNRQRNRERRQARQMQRKVVKETTKPAKKPKRAQGMLTQDAIEARESDMTYGQWMAQKYKEGMKRQSCSRR